MRLTLVALAVAALSPAFAQSGQPPVQPGVTLRTTTTLVQVNVVAHDAKGQAVADLKKEDFEVLDNGIPQEIAVFSADRATPAPRAAPLSPFASDAVEPVGAHGGYAAIVFDGYNDFDSQQPFAFLAARARAETEKMLSRFDPAGRIALYFLDAYKVKLIADFGSDKATLLTRLAGANFERSPMCYSQWVCVWEHELGTLAALEGLADALSFMPGRKALIWVSSAVDASGDLQWAFPVLEGEIELVLRKMNNADVALYPVSPTRYHARVMEDFASRTGGAAFLGASDLNVAIQAAAEDVRVTYSLSFYAPPGSPADFHKLKVQVRRPGITLKYKQGYSLESPGTATAASLTPPLPEAEARALALEANTRASNMPVSKQLEILASAPSPGNAGASMLLPYFYTAPNVAVIDLTMEIGTADLRLPNVDGRQRAELNLLAVASRPDGGVAARFTDAVKLDFATERDVEAFRERPYRYEHQFRLASGPYDVRVVFGSLEIGFGKAEMPLMIDAWDGQRLALSGVALAKESRKVSAAFAPGLDAASLQGRKALIARSAEIIPAGNSVFQRGEPCQAFFEVYEPLLSKPNPPRISLQIRVFDRQNGEQKVDSGVFAADNLIRAGEQVVPVSLTVPIAALSPGAYRLEVKAMRSPGDASAVRTVEFDVEE